MKIPRQKPLLIVSFCASFSPLPSIRDTRILIPVPVPVAMAVISSCRGKNKGQGRQPVKGVLGHKVAVHNIVDGLDQQGQHDGRA
ncbi:MAG: hypothetical protein ACLSA0_03025 [Eisenbergiella massiliensis]